MTVDFFQIYYNEEQRTEMYSCAIPVFNKECTDFFENSVIADLVPKSTADYVGVNSWRLRQKRYDGWCPVILKGDLDITLEKFHRYTDVDVFNLNPRKPGHPMLSFAQMWHGGPEHNFAWENAIKELKKVINVPEEVSTAIYENCQVVRTELYKEYVKDFLNPIMAYMEGVNVFSAASGYAPKKARDHRQQGVLEAYQKRTGRKDYPIAPFVLERLFSIWIEGKKLNVVNI